MQPLIVRLAFSLRTIRMIQMISDRRLSDPFGGLTQSRVILIFVGLQQKVKSLVYFRIINDPLVL